MAHEVTAWLHTNVLIILSTDLAHLESGAHFTVDLILFLCDFNVALLCWTENVRQVLIVILTIRVKIAGGYVCVCVCVCVC